MDVTKEYFDQAIKNVTKGLATKDDVKNLATKEELKNLATKDDVKNLATKEELKKLATKEDVREGVEELARIIAETIANPMEIRFSRLEKKFEMIERVHRLETNMEKPKRPYISAS